MSTGADVPVPYWPRYLPAARAEAAAAVQCWPTRAAESALDDPEARLMTTDTERPRPAWEATPSAWVTHRSRYPPRYRTPPTP